MLIEEQWGIENALFNAYHKNAFPVIVKSLWAQTHKNTH